VPLRQLCEDDLELQTALIQASLRHGSDGKAVLCRPEGGPGSAFPPQRCASYDEHRKPSVSGACEHHSSNQDVNCGEDAALLDGEHALSLASAIATSLRERAIPVTGGFTWIHSEFRAAQERYLLLPVDHGLYSGCAGIALFLSMLARTAGDSAAAALALSALGPLRRKLWSEGERLADVIGLGTSSGLGGLVYALVRCHELLLAPHLLEDSQRAASLITSERLAADRCLDVSGGTAGALLGLLSLYHTTRDPGALERAAMCGAHLLKRRTAGKNGLRAWCSGPAPILAGFAHGAAGISYALLRLHQVIGDAALREAAEEAIACEDALYSAEAWEGWLDLRPLSDGESRRPPMAGWCSGAPGIGLARLGTLQVLDTSAVRRDIERTLVVTRWAGAAGVDTLCCGSLGRTELYATAARRLSRPELHAEARRHLASIVDRAAREGHWRLSPGLPQDIYVPGFFQGIAGIGYALLRAAHPSTVRSVLLWD
jgi:type 2 lantibiotic biosynthesis protein LanM